MVLFLIRDRDHCCCFPLIRKIRRDSYLVWYFLGSSMCPHGDVSANCCGSHQVQVHGVWLSWLTTPYPQWDRFVEDFSVVWLEVNFHLFVLPFYGLECSTVVGGGSRHGLYRDQSRIGLPLQNNQFYSSNAWLWSQDTQCRLKMFSTSCPAWIRPSQ